MNSRKVVQCMVTVGALVILATSSSVQADEIRDPMDPNKVVTPAGPAEIEESDTSDTTESSEVTEETKKPKKEPKEKQKSKKKVRVKENRIWLSDMFKDNQEKALNPDDGSGGGTDSSNQKGYLADIASRFAGKVLIAQ